MDLQTLIVIITVGLAAAFVIRTFARQFTSRGHKGCSSCVHGGADRQPGAGRDAAGRGSGAGREGDLIQVEEPGRK